MNKKKSKSKATSESKKLKKELAEKLTIAFTSITAEYGKLKKHKAVIEKFAKHLSKKIDFKAQPVLPTATNDVATEKPIETQKAKPVAATKAKPAKKTTTEPAK